MNRAKHTTHVTILTNVTFLTNVTKFGHYHYSNPQSLPLCRCLFLPYSHSLVRGPCPPMVSTSTPAVEVQASLPLAQPQQARELPAINDNANVSFLEMKALMAQMQSQQMFLMQKLLNQSWPPLPGHPFCHLFS